MTPDVTTRRNILLLFALALGVRLAFLLFVSSQYPLGFYGAELKQVAMNIATGRGFSSPFGPGDTPTAHFAPIVPYLWAATFRLAGNGTAASALIIRVLQAIVSALAVVLFVLITERVRRRSTALPASTPLAVGLALAFWPESLFKMTVTWYFQWQELALAVVVYLGIRWIDRPTYATAAVAGVSVGAAALINPVPAIMLAPILAIPVLGRAGRGWIDWALCRRALVCGVVSLLVILPWTVRNYVTFHEFIPVRGNFNMELLQSHHPDASPLQHSRSFHPAVRRDARALYDSLGEREYMMWAGEEARRHIRDDPRLAFERTLQRVALFWFTNALDTYRWKDNMPRWWQRCCALQKAERLVTIVSAIVPLLLVLFFMQRGAYRCLPYKPIFLCIFLLIPILYYLTGPMDRKSMIVRPWLAMLVVIGFAIMRGMGDRLRGRGLQTTGHRDADATKGLTSSHVTDT